MGQVQLNIKLKSVLTLQCNIIILILESETC